MQEKREIQIIDEDEDPKGFCCVSMKEFVIDHPDELVAYSACERSYSLRQQTKPYGTPMRFCPWCGSPAPRDLSDLRIDILVEEYGIDPEDIFEDPKVPPEFKTDEWWKKRGL